MDLNKLMKMAMENAKNLAEQQKIQELANSNTLLIMAKTISRLVPNQQIESELQKSLDEIRDYYFQNADYEEDEDAIEGISELTGLAKNIAIDVLKIADDMETD
ncbi:hypothetical protein [Psychrobacter sp. 72-O-c]|uniref:hypothetical protein n=1 Tax=Psychrobacter sp. 72-O-c TaxID=2774125 RepID=UPI001918FF18|nr:hypothetical protein [Psychrobacter sp. 72-O-c]